MRDLLQRVQQSPVFARCTALRAFLTYIVENAITGKLELIKEQSIGSAVLGRAPNYDPTTDNIVRVRAHELRQKLDKHFQTVGIHEPVVISVPRGTYVPEFRARTVEAPLTLDPPVPESPAHEPEAVSESKAEAPVGVESPHRLKIWLYLYLPWLLAIAMAAALVLAMLHASSVQRVAKAAQPPQAIRDFWGPLFADPNREALAISADSGFALWQNLSGEVLNLGDYLARKYLQVGPTDPRMRELAARRLTSPADLAVTVRLSEMSRLLGGQLLPVYARNVQVQQFRTANAVLLGSRRSNPWVELFESKLNFVLVLEDKTHVSFFRNLSPKPGEEPVYNVSGAPAALGTEEHEVDSYALIAVVPGLDDNGRVVLIEGLNMEGTQAAGEMVTDPIALAGMLRQMGHQPGTPVPPFEALLKLTSVPGGYANSKAISFHYLKK